MKKNPQQIYFMESHVFHSLLMYQVTRNGDKMQIRSNPSLSLPITSFMHRPNPGDPQRTSNISHKTQQKRKSVTETRNVLLLTEAGHSLLKFSKELHFPPASLHVTCMTLEGCGVWFFLPTWWLIARKSVLWNPNTVKCHFCHSEIISEFGFPFSSECVFMSKSGQGYVRVRVWKFVCMTVCECEQVKRESGPPDSALHTCIPRNVLCF